MKTLIKLGVWLAVGVASICALLSTATLETPWQYSVNSTVGAGSAITVSQLAADRAAGAVERENELIRAETPVPLSAQKTVDVGAPLSLIAVFVLGSITTYGLKARRRIPGYARQPG